MPLLWAFLAKCVRGHITPSTVGCLWGGLAKDLPTWAQVKLGRQQDFVTVASLIIDGSTSIHLDMMMMDSGIRGGPRPNCILDPICVTSMASKNHYGHLPIVICQVLVSFISSYA